MFLLLTKKGLSQLDLSELKLISKFEGWKCEVGANHLYDIAFRDNKVSIDSIPTCGARMGEPKKMFSFFKSNNFLDCPYKNCYCGTDIEIPKGKTISHVKTLRKLCGSLSRGEAYDLPKYCGESEILAVGSDEFLLNCLVTVEWYLGKRCNFDCSYCPPSIHDNTSAFPSLEELENSFVRLINKIEEENINLGKKKINYYFHGGEPTLIPSYLEFLKRIGENSRTKYMNTLTNLSRNADYFYELNQVSHITYSAHLEYLTDRVLAKLDKLLKLRDETSLSFLVKIMYMREHKEKIYEILNVVKTYKNIKITICPIQNKKTRFLVDYDEEDNKFFRSEFINDFLKAN